MPYSFQFVPVSGDLSGTSLEKQTERAINEIGALTDQAIDSSDEAIEIANGAVATANNALSTAEAANGTAQTANATANNALSVANGIDGKADTAIATANNALSIASGIESKTDEALQRADDAYDLAQTAQASADAAQASADEANEQALNAGNVANMAVGIFASETEAIDADEEVFEPKKLFVTSTEATNFPAAVPLYFSIVVNEDTTSATQFVWSATDPGKIFTRSASIEYPDPLTDPTVTFTEWASLGGGGSSDMFTGLILPVPYRATELPTGMYFCNGGKYALSSPQGQKLNSLPDNYKADFGISVDGDGNINLPNMFYTDGRGYGIRFADGTTRLPGATQDDTMRNITGTYRFYMRDNGGVQSSSASGAITNVTVSTYYPARGNEIGPMSVGFNLNTGILGTNFNGTETSGLSIFMTPAIILGV